MADEDMLTALQRMLSTAGGMLPRAPQPYPGMRPAPGAMPGGNAYAGLPQLPQAGPPGMAGLGIGQMQPGAANLQMPQPGAAPLQAGDWDALIKLLRDAGIGPSQPAQPWQSPVQVTGDWSRGLTGKNPPMLPGWQAKLQLPPVQF